MTDTKQPEALRLADRFADITDWWDFDARTWIPRTEAELRRLHEENERLLAANRDSSRHFDSLMADHKKLNEVNGELVEVLNKCLRHGSGIMSDDPRSYLPLTILNNARETLAKATRAKATGEQA